MRSNGLDAGDRHLGLGAVDIQERMDLVTRGTREVVTLGELRSLLETKARPRAYWGFEISGPLHLGTGLLCGNKIRDLVDAGFEFVVFLADIHSMINRKFGGDLVKIKRAGEYVRHCFIALGLGPDKVQFVWASDLAREYRYWDRVLQVARNVSLRRVKRALPIMGREMGLTDVEAAFLLYPCMQVSDIFELDLDVACAGIDQRKAHMLARDVAEKTGDKKPVSLHTPLLMGLKPTGERMDYDENLEISAEISMKMSKSVPQSAVHIHDSPEEIRAKISGAYCPPGEAVGNPIMQIAKHIVLPKMDKLGIDRPGRYGGPLEVSSYQDLERIYTLGELHPVDLKAGVADALVEILKPVREYFNGHPEALEIMRNIEVTR